MLYFNRICKQLSLSGFVRRSFACFIFCLLALGLSSCQSNESRLGAMLNLKTNLKLALSIAGDANPDEAMNASPVFVRLYELKANEAFTDSNFIDLYERDQEVLADAFIARQDLEPLIPGTERSETFVLSEETRFVALFAEFFQYENADYSVIFPVTKNNILKDTIEVRVRSNRIELPVLE